MNEFSLTPESLNKLSEDLSGKKVVKEKQLIDIHEFLEKHRSSKDKKTVLGVLGAGEIVMKWTSDFAVENSDVWMECKTPILSIIDFFSVGSAYKTLIPDLKQSILAKDKIPPSAHLVLAKIYSLPPYNSTPDNWKIIIEEVFRSNNIIRSSPSAFHISNNIISAFTPYTELKEKKSTTFGHEVATPELIGLAKKSPSTNVRKISKEKSPTPSKKGSMAECLENIQAGLQEIVKQPNHVEIITLLIDLLAVSQNIIKLTNSNRITSKSPNPDKKAPHPSSQSPFIKTIIMLSNAIIAFKATQIKPTKVPQGHTKDCCRLKLCSRLKSREKEEVKFFENKKFKSIKNSIETGSKMDGSGLKKKSRSPVPLNKENKGEVVLNTIKESANETKKKQTVNILRSSIESRSDGDEMVRRDSLVSGQMQDSLMIGKSSNIKGSKASVNSKKNVKNDEIFQVESRVVGCENVPLYNDSLVESTPSMVKSKPPSVKNSMRISVPLSVRSDEPINREDEFEEEVKNSSVKKPIMAIREVDGDLENSKEASVIDSKKQIQKDLGDLEGLEIIESIQNKEEIQLSGFQEEFESVTNSKLKSANPSSIKKTQLMEKPTEVCLQLMKMSHALYHMKLDSSCPVDKVNSLMNKEYVMFLYGSQLKNEPKLTLPQSSNKHTLKKSSRRKKDEPEEPEESCPVIPKYNGWIEAKINHQEEDDYEEENEREKENSPNREGEKIERQNTEERGGISKQKDGQTNEAFELSFCYSESKVTQKISNMNSWLKSYKDEKNDDETDNKFSIMDVEGDRNAPVAIRNSTSHKITDPALKNPDSRFFESQLVDLKQDGSSVKEKENKIQYSGLESIPVMDSFKQSKFNVKESSDHKVKEEDDINFDISESYDKKQKDTHTDEKPSNSNIDTSAVKTEKRVSPHFDNETKEGGVDQMASRKKEVERPRELFIEKSDISRKEDDRKVNENSKEMERTETIKCDSFRSDSGKGKSNSIASRYDRPIDLTLKDSLMDTENCNPILPSRPKNILLSKQSSRYQSEDLEIEDTIDMRYMEKEEKNKKDKRPPGIIKDIASAQKHFKIKHITQPRPATSKTQGPISEHSLKSLQSQHSVKSSSFTDFPIQLAPPSQTSFKNAFQRKEKPQPAQKDPTSFFTSLDNHPQVSEVSLIRLSRYFSIKEEMKQDKSLLLRRLLSYADSLSSKKKGERTVESMIDGEVRSASMELQYYMSEIQGMMMVGDVNTGFELALLIDEPLIIPKCMQWAKGNVKKIDPRVFEKIVVRIKEVSKGPKSLKMLMCNFLKPQL